MKLLVQEAGSVEASTVWRAADEITSSRLLYPEARAALAAAGRARRLRGKPLAVVRQELEALWDDMTALELTPELAQVAGDLAETHGLRGYDAVHLASLEQVAADDTMLVSADRGLLAAAAARGFRVAAIAA